MFTSTEFWSILVVFGLLSFSALYYFSVSTFDRWKKLNVPYIRPYPLFGNFFGVAMNAEHPVDLYRKIYNKLAGHKYGGFFQMRTPYLMIRDPEMINAVLIKDYQYFPDRGIYSDFKTNPLSNNLFFMGGPQWKVIRSKLTPAFTSGKLKAMYGQIKQCGDELMENICLSLKESNNEIEVKNILERYSIDVIGSCAFGIQCNAVNDNKSEFRRYGKTIFKASLRVLLREVCLMISPKLLKIVKLTDFPSDATDFFRSVFKETITYREQNGIIRNDFIQVLMQARKDLVLNDSLPQSEKFTEVQIVANAFTMFVAGFETTSTTISYCLFELALKKHIQDKVREEIRSKKSEHNGQINHEFLSDLSYLDMVLEETLRKYPVVTALFRETAQKYHVPNSSLILEKGQKIMIPTFSIHYDTRYYTDPEVFDPQRFSSEEKAKRPRGTYFPFGDGPRICIGKRFAEIEMKLALTEILLKYEMEPCEKTVIPLRLKHNTQIAVNAKTGIWLKFRQISE